MKGSLHEWQQELLVNTIIAVVITLLFYILGMDKSWEEASTTFGTCFLVMFVLGLYNRYKKNKSE